MQPEDYVLLARRRGVADPNKLWKLAGPALAAAAGGEPSEDDRAWLAERWAARTAVSAEFPAPAAARAEARRRGVSVSRKATEIGVLDLIAAAPEPSAAYAAAASAYPTKEKARLEAARRGLRVPRNATREAIIGIIAASPTSAAATEAAAVAVATEAVAAAVAAVAAAEAAAGAAPTKASALKAAALRNVRVPKGATLHEINGLVAAAPEPPEARIAAAGQFPDMRAARAEAARLGIRTPQGATWCDVLDLIVAGPPPPPPPMQAPPGAPRLDDDQRGVVDWVLAAVDGAEKRRLALMAGPGSGKTTTVVELLARAKAPGRRVLALTFNVAARRLIEKRLRAWGVAVAIQGFAEGKPGLFVVTFDKAASLAVGNRNGYRATKHAAGLDPAWARARWDLVVVDEAQDVSTDEEGLVENLAGARVVVAAGDPRQVVRDGAAWFPAYWAGRRPEEWRALVRNYRSVPRLVEVVNAFSRAHFPGLHYDQVPAGPVADADATDTAADPPFRIHVAADRFAAGELAGRLLAASGPGNAYALGPVSVEKYSLNETTTSLRNAVALHSPGDLCVCLAGDEKVPDRAAFLVGTARKLKGTERSRVVVYGLGENYSINLRPECVARLAFVALSRAVDRLDVILVGRQGLPPLLAPLAPLAGGLELAAAAPSGPRPLPPLLSVVSGLASVDWEPPAVDEPPEGFRGLGAVTPGDGESWEHGDTDFVGCLVEAYVLDALGLLPDLGRLDAALDRDQGRLAGMIDGDRVLCKRGAVEDVKAILRRYRAAPPASAAYDHVLVTFTAMGGARWVVSRRFESEAATGRLTKAARAFAGRLAAFAGARGLEVRKGALFRAALGDSRARQPWMLPETLHPPPTVAGVPDLVLVPAGAPGGAPPAVVVELKHVRELSKSHRRQLYAYMLYTGAPEGILVNCRDGACEFVAAPQCVPGAPPGREWLDLVARAQMAVGQAKSQSVALEPRGLVPLPPAAQPVLVFVDVEHVPTGRGGTATVEIGAIAVSRGSWDVLDCFCRRAPGVRCKGPREGRRLADGRVEYFGAHIAGLATAGDADVAAEGAALVETFCEWAARWPAATLVCWAGSERALLGGSFRGEIDARKEVFVEWLRLRGEPSESGTKLGIAAGQVMPPTFTFAHHQAFEDALATLAITVACSAA